MIRRISFASRCHCSKQSFTDVRKLIRLLVYVCRLSRSFLTCIDVRAYTESTKSVMAKQKSAVTDHTVTLNHVRDWVSQGD